MLAHHSRFQPGEIQNRSQRKNGARGVSCEPQLQFDPIDERFRPTGFRTESRQNREDPNHRSSNRVGDGHHDARPRQSVLTTPRPSHALAAKSHKPNSTTACVCPKTATTTRASHSHGITSHPGLRPTQTENQVGGIMSRGQQITRKPSNRSQRRQMSRNRGHNAKSSAKVDKKSTNRQKLIRRTNGRRERMRPAFQSVVIRR